jgi:hypothetical protein
LQSISLRLDLVDVGRGLLGLLDETLEQVRGGKGGAITAEEQLASLERNLEDHTRVSGSAQDLTQLI